jgi:type I restriction enzyme S subunit
LKSNIGKNSLLAGSYGSVILHLNEDYVGDIKVPVFEEKFEEIERNVSKYIECFNQAIINENQAIDLIEKEIDQWQQ